MSCSCGCCEAGGLSTPVSNRPGLGAIRTRIGTHGSFLQAMLARLSAADYPELAELRTREPSDPSIALLDAWATIADVLTFYQERIANEGYLRTATERRSLVALARLIGYAPRPGVAASVHLAFRLEKTAEPVVIPVGSKANSIPGPGETMEAFETSEPVLARAELSLVRPRLVEPQTPQSILARGLYLKGVATKLTAGEMLLLRPARSTEFVPARVVAVEADAANDRTHVTLAQPKAVPAKALTSLLDVRSVAALLRPRTLTPRSSARLSRSVASSFANTADTLPQLLGAMEPALASTIYPAMANAAPQVAQQIEVYAMRIEARPFGHNAPLQLTAVAQAPSVPTFGEWEIDKPWGFKADKDPAEPKDLKAAKDAPPAHGQRILYLDNDYEIDPGSFAVIEGDKMIVLPHIDSIRHVSFSGYGMSGKSVRLEWTDAGKVWLPEESKDFATVRSTRVYLGSERLDLADAPVTEDVEGDSIELDGLYSGLAPGRWLIVEGERTDIPDGKGDPIPGIRAAELVMVGAVKQSVREVVGGFVNTAPGQGDGKPPPAKTPQPGDTLHSVVTLAAATSAGTPGLAYSYKRDTVLIHANVAPATHGETRMETLGSGNAAEALQSFLLRQPPLTYVSARTPSGVASTLDMRVNEVRWHEVQTLAAAMPADRVYVIRAQDDQRTAITFGNGVRGSRLPTGRDNVKARYRSGIGAPGNVKAGQISLLGSRPLGVKDVVNPIRASGGADREGPEAIRANAPIAILALDRLLSTSDYADFARNFGGIGKASARRVKGRVEVVIAGVDDAPIDETSDLFANLDDALHRFGDPVVPVSLSVRERLSLVVKAGVRIDPDYLWEDVEPKLRAAMLAEFAFDRVELGAPLFLSRAQRAMQLVRGVTWVDIDVFGAVSAEQLLDHGGTKLAGLLTKAEARLSPWPNQIAYLSAAVPDTLILQELPS
jgi:hypothetical protein